MAGVAIEDYVAVFDRAAREKSERKKAMDAIVDLCIERAVLRRALRGLLANPNADAAIAAAVVALEYNAGLPEETAT